jgi:hypothetical protein
MVIGRQCSDTIYGVVCDVISTVAEFMDIGRQCCDTIYLSTGKNRGHLRGIVLDFTYSRASTPATS